CQQHYGYPPTF
nr:immunoglobulin light chain junction region [Macaca mulatta]MOV80054.1 immunoglobulin light chain junction region [Macaca mulatta]MOV80312.1 immunoglobulin light chain junction region [Macaca mulatta]MOV81207.1 immunoglobulin light chain junction region [Macaca mulatta]